MTLALATTGVVLSCVSLILAYLARTRIATLRENLTTALTDNATLRRLLDREATRHVEELAAAHTRNLRAAQEAAARMHERDTVQGWCAEAYEHNLALVTELADLRAELDTAYAELKAKPLPGRETDGRFKKDPR